MTISSTLFRRITSLVVVATAVVGLALASGATEEPPTSSDETIDVTLWRSIGRFAHGIRSET